MVDHIFQQSPAYFKQFAKQFRYIVSEEYPILPADDFALAFHNQKSEFCTLKNVQHWHLLIFTGKQCENYGSTVVCPYAAFKLLILEGINIQFHGDIFGRLNTAIDLNDKHGVDETRAHVLRKKLPKNNAITKIHVGTQTDMLSNASLKRFISVLNGHYGGEFNQIMDAFISGYGCVSLQNHSMLTTFLLVCAPAQCYCFECSN